MPLRAYLLAIAIFCNEVKGKSMLALSRDLGTHYDFSRRHRNLGVAQHIEDRSAALTARNGRRFLAPENRSDRVRLCCRVKHADRSVEAADIIAELQDALLSGDQLARQFGSLLSQCGNDVWIGHPHTYGRVAPGRAKCCCGAVC